MAEIIRLVRADRVVINELIQTTEGWIPVQAVSWQDTEESLQHGRREHLWHVVLTVENPSGRCRCRYLFNHDDLITSRGINGITHGEVLP